MPTPVAVAVSDFCRRARSPAAATEVREALSLLDEAEDFRVREITDREPGDAPVGPFALVDMVRGTAEPVAGQRQGCGYYELVRALVKVQEERSPLPASALEGLAEPAPRAASTRSAEGRAAKAAAASAVVQDRIAPRKRSTELEAEAPDALDAAPAELSTSARPRRDLPLPRGRFTRLAAQKLPGAELLQPEGADLLQSLIAQHGQRAALLKALATQYTGQGGGGAPFTSTDLENALTHHKLGPAMEARERELILASFTEHRGATGRVAWSIGASPSELQKLIRDLGIQDQVSETRERFKREALAPTHLSQRLDLLGRTKYLSDLGIQRRFVESLTADLRNLLRPLIPSATDLPTLAARAGQHHGVNPELVARAIERLGLGDELLKRLAESAASPSP